MANHQKEDNGDLKLLNVNNDNYDPDSEISESLNSNINNGSDLEEMTINLVDTKSSQTLQLVDQHQQKQSRSCPEIDNDLVLLKREKFPNMNSKFECNPNKVSSFNNKGAFPSFKIYDGLWKILLHRPIYEWTVHDVSVWLKLNDFNEYVELFCNQHKIDGRVLINLTSDDLRSEPLKLTVFGDIKRFCLAIDFMKRIVSSQKDQQQHHFQKEEIENIRLDDNNDVCDFGEQQQPNDNFTNSESFSSSSSGEESTSSLSSMTTASGQSFAGQDDEFQFQDRQQLIVNRTTTTTTAQILPKTVSKNELNNLIQSRSNMINNNVKNRHSMVANCNNNNYRKPMNQSSHAENHQQQRILHHQTESSNQNYTTYNNPNNNNNPFLYHRRHVHRPREFRPEAWKAIVALIYFFSSTWITAIVMVIVHDRVPDMDTYPPLPDIILDNLPLIPWAFSMAETCGLILFIIWIIILIFHKHRFILLRRLFSLFGSVFLIRCFTMVITSLSVPGRHLECKARAYGSWSERLHQAYMIWQGGGMAIRGVRTCGDYMFSGHTVVLTMLNFFITEYTPRSLSLIHTMSWVINLFGVFFILAAHEHYSIDVFIAFYITTRLFLYYHTLANNGALYQSDRHRTRIWFPLFSFFESGVAGIVPNEYEIPFKKYFDRLMDHLWSKISKTTWIKILIENESEDEELIAYSNCISIPTATTTIITANSNSTFASPTKLKSH